MEGRHLSPDTCAARADELALAMRFGVQLLLEREREGVRERDGVRGGEGGSEGEGGEERVGESGAERSGAGAHQSRAEQSRAEQSRAEQSGVEWSGVEWSGVEWSGVEWSGVEWSGVEWSGVEWSKRSKGREGGRESKKQSDSQTREKVTNNVDARAQFRHHDVGKRARVDNRAWAVGRRQHDLGWMPLDCSEWFFPIPFPMEAPRGASHFCQFAEVSLFALTSRAKTFRAQILWLNCRLLPLVRCLGAVCFSSDFHDTLLTCASPSWVKCCAPHVPPTPPLTTPHTAFPRLRPFSFPSTLPF